MYNVCVIFTTLWVGTHFSPANWTSLSYLTTTWSWIVRDIMCNVKKNFIQLFFSLKGGIFMAEHVHSELVTAWSVTDSVQRISTNNYCTPLFFFMAQCCLYTRHDTQMLARYIYTQRMCGYRLCYWHPFMT